MKKVFTFLAFLVISSSAFAGKGVICTANLSQDPFNFKGMTDKKSQSIGYVTADFGSVSFEANIDKNDEISSLRIIDFTDGRSLLVDQLTLRPSGTTNLKLLLKDGNYAEIGCQKFN